MLLYLGRKSVIQHFCIEVFVLICKILVLVLHERLSPQEKKKSIRELGRERKNKVTFKIFYFN